MLLQKCLDSVLAAREPPPRDQRPEVGVRMDYRAELLGVRVRNRIDH